MVAQWRTGSVGTMQISAEYVWTHVGDVSSLATFVLSKDDLSSMADKAINPLVPRAQKMKIRKTKY